MSEPHKVSEPKDFSKIKLTDLTYEDLSDILREIELSNRFKFQKHELFAINYALNMILDIVEEQERQ